MKKNRIRPNQLIMNAAENMNETVSTKYGLAPENIENNQMRNDKYNQKLDRRKKTLRSPLNLTENVLVLAESLRKRGASGRLYFVKIC